MTHSTRFPRLLSFIAAAVLAAPAARADPPPAPDVPAQPPAARDSFGRAGHVVIDDLLSLSLAPSNVGGTLLTTSVGPFSYAETTTTSSAGTATETEIGVSPSADVFVLDRLSIGGRATIGYSRYRFEGSSDAETGYTLAFVPRVGYVLPIGDTLAFWPRVGGGYTVYREGDSAFGRTLTQLWSAEADAGFVLRVANHLLLDVGPTLTYATASTNNPPPWASLPYQASGFQGGARGSLLLDF